MEWPLTFFDQESFQMAVPPYDSVRPYRQILFQFQPQEAMEKFVADIVLLQSRSKQSCGACHILAALTEIRDHGGVLSLLLIQMTVSCPTALRRRQIKALEEVVHKTVPGLHECLQVLPPRRIGLPFRPYEVEGELEMRTAIPRNGGIDLF